jgi:hypothetical protein
MYLSFLYELYGVKVYAFLPNYRDEFYSGMRGLLGFALPRLRRIFVRADLHGERRRKVIQHELRHIFSPYEDELTVRALTGTLYI